MRTSLLLVAAACAVLSGCGTRKDVVIGENWAWAGEQVNPTPLRAQASGREGWAVIQCVVQADRRLGSCEVLKEAPASLGFGRAALKLQTGLILQSHNVAPGETVKVPVFFCKDRLSSCGRSSTRFQAAVDHHRATGEGELPTEPDWRPR